MKNIVLTAMLLLLATTMNAMEKRIIRISTNQTDLVLQVGENGRLYQSYLGEKLLHESDLDALSWNVHAASDGSVSRRGWEVYSGSGNEDFFEPAIAITHNDGNPSTWLYYVSSTQYPVEGGTRTDITLRDDQYPVEVTLHYVAYAKENVIKTWSEIRHEEKKPVRLSAYASTMLYFCRNSYYLTEFSSDWAKEAQMSSQRLQPGKKILDTKLGSRAAMHMHPFFLVGLDQPAQERQGEVLMGTLGWTGNFRFTFEVDNVGNLRVIPAINPYASDYQLAADDVFTTPEFIFTLSTEGTGQGSRNLQAWARRYQLKDGMGDRMTLLNNWENTAFDFDQSLLAGLMKEAKDLGVDMFLLDDGWFGNKHPRNNDRAGLGDWDVNHTKLPEGIPALTQAAKDAGIDAVIAWDFAAIERALNSGLEVFLSTQASVANSDSVCAYFKRFGIRRFVLARECSLEAIASIKAEVADRLGKDDAIEIEVFAHGAMCVSISGRPTAAPAGDTCLKLAAAGRPVAAFSSFTSCQLLSASRKLMYPGRPLSTSMGSSPSSM